MASNLGPRATPHFVDHQVEVVLSITTTHDDVQQALARSGLVAGTLIGEALITSVEVYSPDVDDE